VPVPAPAPVPAGRSAGLSFVLGLCELHEHARDALFKFAGKCFGNGSGSYVEALNEIKLRIQQERLRVVMAANSAMVLLYWDIGRMILERQDRVGWGAKVIDRLAEDLRKSYPDMKGCSPRNLNYMRAFAAAWPNADIVQRVVAQLPWRQNIALIEGLDDERTRLWYAKQTLQQGWSQPILCLQIEVGSQDFFVDLLFYHLKLRCYVVIGLKAVPFDPAFVGQLNLYLSAVTDPVLAVRHQIAIL